MSRLTGRAAMRLRAAWQIHIDRGVVKCWRCGELIKPGSTEWDLGHTGLAHVEGGSAEDVAPEHRSQCNRRDGGMLGNTRRRRPRRRLNEWKEAPMTRADKARALALVLLVIVVPGLIPEPASAAGPTIGSHVTTYTRGHSPSCHKLVWQPRTETYRCIVKGKGRTR